MKQSRILSSKTHSVPRKGQKDKSYIFSNKKMSTSSKYSNKLRNEQGPKPYSNNIINLMTSFDNKGNFISKKERGLPGRNTMKYKKPKSASHEKAASRKDGNKSKQETQKSDSKLKDKAKEPIKPSQPEKPGKDKVEKLKNNLDIRKEVENPTKVEKKSPRTQNNRHDRENILSFGPLGGIDSDPK